jgi:hypothetical protein
MKIYLINTVHKENFETFHFQLELQLKLTPYSKFNSN